MAPSGPQLSKPMTPWAAPSFPVGGGRDCVALSLSVAQHTALCAESSAVSGAQHHTRWHPVLTDPLPAVRPRFFCRTITPLHSRLRGLCCRCWGRSQTLRTRPSAAPRSSPSRCAPSCWWGLPATPSRSSPSTRRHSGGRAAAAQGRRRPRRCWWVGWCWCHRECSTHPPTRPWSKGPQPIQLMQGSRESF
jgi:hypothetical protein